MNTKGFVQPREFWDKLFKDSLRVGDFQIEEINDTWVARHIAANTPSDVFDTQQEAVNFAVNHAVFFQIATLPIDPRNKDS